MSISKIVQKLNSLAHAYLDENKLSVPNRCKFNFQSGDFGSELIKVILSIIPSSKVCFLHTKKSYNEFGVRLTKLFGKTNRQFINIILEDDFTDDLQNYSNLFNSGEDVRLVVGCDYILFNACSYIASVRRIECLLLVNNLLTYDILAPYINIKNGDLLDKFNITCFRQVYINDNISSEHIAEAYAFALSHITALIDFTISCEFYPCEQDEKVKELAKDCIYMAHGIMKSSRKRQIKKLLYACIGIELANYLSQGRLKETSSAMAVARLYSKDKVEQIRISFLGMLANLQICNLYISSNEEVFNLPDYLERADKIASVYPIESIFVVKNLTRQSKIVKKKKTDCISNLLDLKTQLSQIQDSINAMRQTYVALQGTTQVQAEKFALAVKHSGDLTNYINLMSLVREKGILEYIE